MKKRWTLLIIFMIWGAYVTLSSQTLHYHQQPGSFSKQNLLLNSQYQWQDGTVINNPFQKTLQTSDTLNILALLVEFQVDDDIQTTGNGTFDLSIPDQPTIDPPPHNTSYFEYQLEALSNYYTTVSRGKLHLVYDVFDQVLQLPQTMPEYRVGVEDPNVDYGLSEIFQDAVLAGDAAGAPFSNYDCFVVFHAGVGRDINFGIDPTPQDVPSAFISLADLQQHIGNEDPTYQGISVENGSFNIKEGLLLPETQNQEGYEIGLLGTMTLMFGFQLGLPAIWNTETGLSGIGRWGLMDQGSGNFNGLIPAQPCAWSRYFLGWEDPVEIRQGDSLQVGCSLAQNENKIYKVPINGDEYYLIENRQYDFNHDTLALGESSKGGDVIFHPDGTIEMDQAEVIVSVDEYDYGLPGSGVLIWHIDEQVIINNLEGNRINADPEHRGVDLEEADGAQDIGESYGFTSPGAGAELGVLHDAWFGDNEIHLLANQSEEVAFAPNTYPSTQSNTNTNTHIVIHEFSTSDSVMTFSAQRDLIQEGFPQPLDQLSDSLNYYPPLYGDIDDDGGIEIVVTASNGKIYAWEEDGSSVLTNPSIGGRIRSRGDTLFFPIALWAIRKDVSFTAFAIGDLNGDGDDEVVTVSTDSVYAWDGLDKNGDGFADLLFVQNLEGGFSGQVMLFPVSNAYRICIGTSQNKLVVFNSDGSLAWEKEFGNNEIAGLCQIPAEGDAQFAVSTKGGDLYLYSSEGNQLWHCSAENGTYFDDLLSSRFSDGKSKIYAKVCQSDLSWEGILITPFEQVDISFKLPDEPGEPIIGDVDHDGEIEIVFSNSTQMWGYNPNGSLVNYFPMSSIGNRGYRSSLLMGDIDGDEKMDLISSIPGQVEAWYADGTMKDGFPLSAGGIEYPESAILDLDGDGDIELASVSCSGYFYVWDLPGQYHPDHIAWSTYGHDPTLSRMHTLPLQIKPAGLDLMPANLVYNYPNPVEGNSTTIRYRLEASAEVDIKIYNLSGERVASFDGPGYAQTENEVVWNLSDVNSGVYFCRVYAKFENQEKVVVCKIAVAK